MHVWSIAMRPKAVLGWRDELGRLNGGEELASVIARGNSTYVSDLTRPVCAVSKLGARAHPTGVSSETQARG